MPTRYQIFSETIPSLLPRTTAEVYEELRKRFPELCDDEPCSHTKSKGVLEWQHEARAAQQGLKQSGIARFQKESGRWELVRGASFQLHFEGLARRGVGAGRKAMIPFAPGKEYVRREVHHALGGQAQYGISTPARHPVILLFSGPSGGKHGWFDRWTEDGFYLFAGEGQKGEAGLAKGNLAVENHWKDGKDLHLFEQLGRGRVKYVGQMAFVGRHTQYGRDSRGKTRKDIVFELAPIQDIVGVEEDPASRSRIEQLWKESPDTLRSEALGDGPDARTPPERKARVCQRSERIKIYARKRAGGRCEGCGAAAPFADRRGRPYLEVHHMRRLSDGGPDHPRYLAALCPNCHRRAHLSKEAPELNRVLLERVAVKEEEPALPPGD
ncbi:MAG: HNH endonuclease [Elusimicrobiota bacterium]